MKFKDIPSIAKAHMEYLLPSRASDIVNHVEMRVIGLARSGTHAIINWLGNNFLGSRLVFINRVDVGKNPYVCRQLLDGTQSQAMLSGFYINLYFEKSGKFRKKDCLIYSYEGDLIEDIVSPVFEHHREEWLGKSAKKYDVLIMRDAFNFMAARVHGWFKKKEF